MQRGGGVSDPEPATTERSQGKLAVGRGRWGMVAGRSAAPRASMQPELAWSASSRPRRLDRIRVGQAYVGQTQTTGLTLPDLADDDASAWPGLGQEPIRR